MFCDAILCGGQMAWLDVLEGVSQMKDRGKRQKMVERRRRDRLIALLGCVVAIATAMALMVPALSMTHDTLACGLEEHEHSEACYGSVLACGLEESENHKHNESCYAQELICGLEEHAHSDGCYESAGEDASEPVQTMAGGAASVDGAEGVGVAGDSEQVSAASGEEALGGGSSGDVAGTGVGSADETAGASGLQGEASAADQDGSSGDYGAGAAGQLSASGEGVTQDTASQVAANGGVVPAATLEEGADAALVDEQAMPAQSFRAHLKDVDDNVVLTVAVEAPEGAFPADTFMKIDGVSAQDVAERVQDAFEEALGDAASQEELALAGAVEGAAVVDVTFFDKDGAVINPAQKVTVKITAPEVRSAQSLVLAHVAEVNGIMKFKDGSVTDADGKSFDDSKDKYLKAEFVKRVQLVNELETDKSQGARNTLQFEAGAFSPYAIVQLNGAAAGVLEAAMADVVVYGDGEAPADDGASVEGDVAGEGEGAGAEADAAGESDGNEDDDLLAEEGASGEDGLIETVNRPAQSFQRDVKDTAGKVSLTVSVEAPEGALPEGVEMFAELVEDEDVLDAAKNEAAGAIDADAGRGDVKAVAADITFRDAAGNEVEPLVAVSVTIATPLVSEAPAESLAVVHVADDMSAEVVEGAEVDAAGESVAFEAEAFSVYAVVYTVDFHWEVDGKEYEFNIPGGGFVSLEHLFEALGIGAGDANSQNESEDVAATHDRAVKLSKLEVSEATKEFVADVKEVEFSSPELVWVGKVNEAATVGELKKANGLKVEYSADLSEGQIAEINAQAVEAGDWALISIYPFDTEETLVVTMKNGDVFTILITDNNVELGSSLFRDIMDGKYFYLYTFYEGDQGSNMAATRGDYYLKYDGSAKRLNQYMHNIDNDVIDELGNDYLWQIAWEDDSDNYYGGAWIIRNMGQPNYYLTLEDYYTITSENGNSRINILAKLADGSDALIFLGNVDEEYYEYYESGNAFSGFSFDNGDTELKLVFNNSTHTFDIDTSAYVYLGATIKAVSVDSVQPMITFTQDNSNGGTVSFTDEVGTLHETSSSSQTITQDTMSSGQSRYLVTAEPTDGYHLREWQVVSGAVTAWGSSSGNTAQSVTIQPIIEGENAIIKAVFEPNQAIGVTQNSIDQGHVEFNNGVETIASNDTNTTINVLTLGPNAEGNYRSLYNISAVPSDDYRFVKWEVEGDGRVVSWGKDSSMTEYTTQINPYVTDGAVTLKAIFEKIPTGTTLDPSTEAGQLVNQLMRELREDSADFKKTAHVIDEDKRIYQVNLSASSERKIIGPDITLSFITDISRSMYFPANLTPVAYTNNDNVRPNNLENWLRGHGRNSDGTYNTYYMIADINGTATVLALFHDSDGNWKTMDASYYDDIFHDGERIGTSNNYRSAPPNSRKGGFSSTYLERTGNGYRIRTGGSPTTIYSAWYDISDLDSSGNVRLYTASSTKDSDGIYFTRLDYLKKAVKIISDVIYAVDEDAEIGLVTFAKKSYTRDEYGNRVYTSPDANSYVAELYGKDDGFPGLDNIVLTGGTRQDHGLETAVDMNWFGTNPNHPQVAILITDGAPNTTDSGNYSDPWGDLIGPKATTLKNRDVELYTLGLSLENVGNNKQQLYKIAGEKSDNPGSWNASSGLWSGIDGKYQNNAETGEETIERLMEILRSMEITGNLLGSVSDTVDPAFYPVDANGYPIQEGVFTRSANGVVNRLGNIDDYLSADGKPLRRIRGTNTPNPLYNEKNTIEYFTWTEDNGAWSITWYNQLIETVKTNGEAGWTNSFRVKAKEDFLGGNAINTNEGEATITADRFKQKEYPETIGTFAEPVTASVRTPRVNVAELLLDENSTEWTVYLDTSINSRLELEALYNQISVFERVTKVDSDNRIDSTGDHCMPGSDTGSNTIPFSQVLSLTSSEWDRLMSGETISHHYEAYGHMDVGVIKIELIKEGLARKVVHLGEHPASPVGDESEKYTLKVTYTPNPEDASTVWNTTQEESRGRPASSDAMSSENHHTVNVFAEPIQVLKKDDSGEDVRGATFSLYRKAKTGETGVLLAEYDETLTGSYYCISSQTTNADGIATLALPSDGQNSKNLLVPGEEYYLIETVAPVNYRRDTSVRRITVETAYDSVAALNGEGVETDDYPYNWDEGVIVKVDGIPAVIVDTSGNPVTLVDNNGSDIETVPLSGSGSGSEGDGDETGGRKYVLSGDPVFFQTTILNVRIADFRFKKISNDGSGLPGAVFQLKAIKNSAEVLVTDDPDYAGIEGISETVEVEVNGEAQTFQSAFVTTGDEQIISKLKDGTYILEEVYVPAGYVKSVGKIRFVINRGIMAMDMETPLPDDIIFVPGKQTVNDPTLAFLTIKNAPGAALPNTGGSGTNMIYLLGIMLVGIAGAVLLTRMRRSAALSCAYPDSLGVCSSGSSEMQPPRRPFRGTTCGEEASKNEAIELEKTKCST